MFCMHTYPYYGIVSATGDVAIKKPKVRTMDFHGLSLRPLVVKGLIFNQRGSNVCGPILDLVRVIK